MKIAGTSPNGSHDRPPPAVAIGIPGAVDTNSGGPCSSTTGAGGGVTVASCGTRITDCSVGVPSASAGVGPTGRHMTTVVECAAAGLALWTTRRARRTTGRCALLGVVGFGLGTTFEATLRTGALRRTTGFFLTEVATGEHSTSESTDAGRATGF